MAGRPKKFDEQEVLDIAAEIFWRKGYEATSTDDLLKAMGIGKGSFYLMFKDGKKELFKRTLSQFSKKRFIERQKEIAESGDKIKSLKAFFLKRLEQNNKQGNLGCFIGNTVVEMSNIDPEMMEYASNHLLELEDHFYNIVDEAQKLNQIKSELPPEVIAKHLINLWNGMNITKRMKGDISLLKQAVELNLQILD